MVSEVSSPTVWGVFSVAKCFRFLVSVIGSAVPDGPQTSVCLSICWGGCPSVWLLRWQRVVGHIVVATLKTVLCSFIVMKIL